MERSNDQVSAEFDVDDGSSNNTVKKEPVIFELLDQVRPHMALFTVSSVYRFDSYLESLAVLKDFGVRLLTGIRRAIKLESNQEIEHGP